MMRMIAGHERYLTIAALVVLALGGRPDLTRAQGQSVLVGTVSGLRAERRLHGAAVSIDSLHRQVRTDSSGAFRIEALPAGKHAIRVVHDGFAILDTTLAFSGRDTIRGAFVLESADDTLDATDHKMADFERRRARGLGWFLTRDDLAGANDRALSDVLVRRIPGIALNRNGRGYGIAIASRRGVGAQASGDGFPAGCYVQLFVDGTRIYAPGENSSPVDINQWRASDLEGVEFYPGPQQTPPEFAGMGSTCGTLALWLRVE